MTNPMTDTRPPVAPAEGAYGRLRDGTIHGPIVSDFHPRDGIAYWVPNDLIVDPNGKGSEPRDDLVELITPEAMQAAASGRLSDCEDRLFDLLLGNEGQANKEGRRYLEQHRPDLADRLDENDDTTNRKD